MKKYLVGLFLVFTLSAFSQQKNDWKEYKKNQKEHQAQADTTNFPKPFEFTFVDTSSLSKDQLFSKINLWLATAFKNMNLDVAKDQDAGKIVLPDVKSSYSGGYSYNLTIDVRDKKYRFVFTHFFLTSEYAQQTIDEAESKKGGMYIGTTKQKYWASEKLWLMKEAIALFASAKQYIEKNDDF